MTAMQLIMFVEPTDDAGARTADLFEWQAAMAATDGLALYLDSLGAGQHLSRAEDGRVVCEFHEDWVVAKAGAAELVSAKHKDLSFGAYTTVQQLFDDGGLAHLFQRWHMMREATTCRLVTTAGLKRGPAQDLAKAAKELCKQRLAGAPLLVTGKLAKAVAAAVKVLQASFPDALPASWKTDNGRLPALSETAKSAQVQRFLSVTLFHRSGEMVITK